MKQKNNSLSGFAALMAVALSATFAQARSLLYYYDFDTVTDGALVWQNANKGTGTRVPVYKHNTSQSGTPAFGFTAEGAFGSDHAFYTSDGTSINDSASIWLGTDAEPLECGTTNGFTISFWCKLSSSHGSDSNFFGFRVGGRSYRFQYESTSDTTFTIRGSGDKAGAVTLRNGTTGIVEQDRLFYSDVPANEWHHFAIVATPNGTNTLGTSGFYVDGEKIGYLALVYAGALQQINIGQTVREGIDGTDRTSWLNGSAQMANTAIDELAVFDYPATVEQLKWLAKFKPAQPANGPAREMPYCWHFDTTNKTYGATAKVNSGTGSKKAFLFDIEDESTEAMKKADETRIVEPTTKAALGTAYAGRLGGRPTWRVVDSEGLGPTVGSGFTISFWMRADQNLSDNYSTIFSFCVGGRYLRYDFDDASSSKISIKGKEGSKIELGSRKAGTWQHYCAVWNNDTQEIDYYIDGFKKGNGVYKTTQSLSDAVTALYAGRLGYSGDGSEFRESINYMNNTYIDEVALFNHSFSPEQVQWLAQNVPCLPALDATNLVRTVSENASWSGGLASWGVREWDAEYEAWALTSRTTIYPALEDTEVDVEVTLADGVTIANDTFVTPKSLVFKSDTGASVSATFDCAEGSMFAPATFELGEGVNLSVTAGAIAMNTGTIKFNEGSSIKVDCDGIDNEWTEVLSANDFILPEGPGTVLDYVKAKKGSYTFKVDGGKIVCKKVRGLMIIFR